MTCHLTLFGLGDSEQEVLVEYEIEEKRVIDNWEWVTEYTIVKVKVLDTVVIEPSDLLVDCCEGIVFIEGLTGKRVKMECEVEAVITAEITVKL